MFGGPFGPSKLGNYEDAAECWQEIWLLLCRRWRVMLRPLLVVKNFQEENQPCS